MSPRLAWILLATFAPPALALAQAEAEIVKAIHARLEAVRHNDMTTWATFVADEMMAPLEGATRSKQSWIAQHKSWPREVSYRYGPLQIETHVRRNGEPVEWRPETETTFFMPGAAAGGDASRIIFAKDAGGRVTHYIYRELGANDRIVKKIE